MVEHVHTAHARRRWLAVALIAVALLGVGAEFAIEGPPWAGSRRVLWRGSSVPGHLGAHFRFFDGSDSRRLTASAGQTLTLRYDLEPVTGVLGLNLLSPDGDAIWARSAAQPATGSATVPLPESGRYRVEITGDQTRGSFAVDYRVEAPAGP